VSQIYKAVGGGKQRIDREFEKLLLRSKLDTTNRGNSPTAAVSTIEKEPPSSSPTKKANPTERVKPYVNLTGPGDYDTASIGGFGSVQKGTSWRRNSPSFSFSSGRENKRQFISKDYLRVMPPLFFYPL
jgi:hypothetical protein